MLLHRKYIIIIDDAPKDIQIEEYFNKYDYQVLHYNKVPKLNTIVEMPVAFLIHSSMLSQIKLSTINIFYQGAVPLVVLHNEKDEKMCVRMLDEGADDFLVKPILVRELHARIGALSRRIQRSLKKDNDQERDVLTFDNWRLYPASRQIFDINQQELQLSVGEYDLLLAFVHRPHQILGREFLLQMTKNNRLNPFDRRIDVQISRLRQKIETDSKKPALIKTIRNGGYLFTAQVFSMKEKCSSNLKIE